MEPYYQDAQVTLYHGDAIEILPQLGIYDVVLTDPCYGLGKKWQGGTWGAQDMYATDAQGWDSATFSDSTLAEVRRSGVRVIIWGGNYYALPPSRCWLVWNKEHFAPTLANCELAWTNLDMPAKMFGEFRSPGCYSSKEHPTQKPLSLFKWCLSFCPDAKTICDPFVGSGTTLRAAKDMGFKTIVGIEKVEKYCEVSAKRLSQKTLAFD